MLRHIETIVELLVPGIAYIETGAIKEDFKVLAAKSSANCFAQGRSALEYEMNASYLNGLVGDIVRPPFLDFHKL